MKAMFQYLSLSLLIPTGLALADTPHQECIGRMTFDVPEDVEWATFHANYTNRITEGGGHGFGLKVGASGDSANYDYDGLVIYVSNTVERSAFEGAARYIKGSANLYQKELYETVETKKGV